jgi:Ni,Fe-hydrogenase maturation factor
LPRDEDILLVGIEAEDVVTFGEECTPAVEAAIAPAVETVLAAVEAMRAAPQRGSGPSRPANS